MDYKAKQKAAKESTMPRTIAYGPKNNRLARRQKIVDRSFTKKDHAFGIKIGSKEFNLVHHIAKRQA